MTLNDLVELYRENSWHPNIHIHPDEKAGIRAVVEALRDEMRAHENIDTYVLDEILASDGVEAGTHGSPELDEDARKLKALGQEVFAPAAAPSAQSDIAKAFEAEMRAVAAPDVCVWTSSKRKGRFVTACEPNDFIWSKTRDTCHCGRPIKFTEAAR